MIHSYDKYIVAFSGGKDSLAVLLYLLKAGVDKSKIELWHHDVDGREGSNLMDWSVTPSYVEACAQAFDIPLYNSWREGGFEREMLRENSLTGGVYFQTPDKGLVYKPAADRSQYYNTRRKFPQLSADLSVRWCSGYMKVDIMASAIRNQERFYGIRTIVLTGERGEESTARSHYQEFEPHRTDLRHSKSKPRYIDHFRPILNWTEQRVWDIIKEYAVNLHPAYHLGFGRVSCLFCLFGGKNQFASAKEIAPERFEKIADYEDKFGVTIKRKKESIRDFTAKGTPFENMDAYYLKLARSTNFDAPIFLPAGEWKLPRGAFSKETCGAL